MCGFAAMFEEGRAFDPPLLDAINNDLLHRGPDGGGRYIEEGAALLFRRLAILDPKARSDQPFTDQSGRYLLVFNGEIYNFKALREELISAGSTFRTTGDTEVIAEGFTRWGEGLFEKLEGMFALVIYDRTAKKVYLARDPFGIKPLYIARTANGFAAASEMRPLRRFLGRTEVDEDALSELLIFRFAAGRHSNIKGIEQLPGGTMASFSITDRSYSERRFADPLETLKPDESLTYETCLELAEEALNRSVQDHLQSDVGYSIQLSGGVDSSLVLALATDKAGRSLESYGIRLSDERFDESRYRESVVERYNARHHEIELGAVQFAEALPRSIHFMEGPSPHMGCVMLMLLCETIKEKHKVVLTGEGADEFFGGYERYSRWRTLQRYQQLGNAVPTIAWPLLSRYKYVHRFARYEPAAVAAAVPEMEVIETMFPTLIPRPGWRNEVAGRFSDFRDRMLAIDQTAYLSSLLMRQDRMAMAAGIEARVPFTHFPLAKVLNRIPRNLRIPGGETKPLLKAIARKWLPASVVDRRKVGLNLPIGEWLKDENILGRYLSLLSEPNCKLATYAERKVLTGAVDEFRKNEKTASMPALAQLVNVELWLRSLDDIKESVVLNH